MSAKRLRSQFAHLSLLLFLGCVVSMALAGQEPTPRAVSLCDLGKAPEKFDGQLILVTAQYESDGTEREGLSDSLCRNLGVALTFTETTLGKEDLRTALHGGYPGTLDKTITGTFVGVFQWRPGSHPPRDLAVKKMYDFKVRHMSNR